MLEQLARSQRRHQGPADPSALTVPRAPARISPVTKMAPPVPLDDKPPGRARLNVVQPARIGWRPLAVLHTDVVCVGAASDRVIFG